jgi:hypothetical protein
LNARGCHSVERGCVRVSLEWQGHSRSNFQTQGPSAAGLSAEATTLSPVFFPGTQCSYSCTDLLLPPECKWHCPPCHSLRHHTPQARFLLLPRIFHAVSVPGSASVTEVLFVIVIQSPPRCPAMPVPTSTELGELSPSARSQAGLSEDLPPEVRRTVI